MTDIDRIRSIIEDVVKENVGQRDPGILFSGGLDSSIIAAVALRVSRPMAYTVGLEGAHDLVVSELTARSLGLTWKPIVLTSEDIILSIKQMLRIIRIIDPVIASFQLPFYIVASEAKEKILLSGQGADELFGGYAKYEAMGQEALSTNMGIDLEKAIRTSSSIDEAIGAHFSKQIVHPYLDPKILRLVREIPCEQRMRNGVRKALLRDVARAMRLTDVADRPKKAAQYGSGIMKVMKAEARRRKVSLRGLIDDLS